MVPSMGGGGTWHVQPTVLQEDAPPASACGRGQRGLSGAEAEREELGENTSQELKERRKE